MDTGRWTGRLSRPACVAALVIMAAAGICATRGQSTVPAAENAAKAAPAAETGVKPALAAETAAKALPAAEAVPTSLPAIGAVGVLTAGGNTTAEATTQTSDIGGRPIVFKDSGRSGGGPTKAPGSVIWELFASVIVILFLGALALLVVKKVLPRVSKASAGRKVRVIETTGLGPRKMVYLLQVGSRKYLVGGGRDNVEMLGEVTDAFAEGTEKDSPG